jgi:hypothetical protein
MATEEAGSSEHCGGAKRKKERKKEGMGDGQREETVVNL